MALKKHTRYYLQNRILLCERFILDLTLENSVYSLKLKVAIIPWQLVKNDSVIKCVCELVCYKTIILYNHVIEVHQNLVNNSECEQLYLKLKINLYVLLHV